jgi:hypothetical protein
MYKYFNFGGMKYFCVAAIKITKERKRNCKEITSLFYMESITGIQ